MKAAQKGRFFCAMPSPKENSQNPNISKHYKSAPKSPWHRNGTKIRRMTKGFLWQNKPEGWSICMHLFSPIIDTAHQHPNFRNVLSRANGFDMDVVNDWAKDFVDRDGKFVREFQTTFNSSFWELYLFAVLKKYGMAVDFSKPSPDFFLPEQGINIEAVVASNADREIPEYQRSSSVPPPDLNEFNRQAIVRLSNSLTSKHKKYLDTYSSLEHVRDKPFVIAVASFDRPYIRNAKDKKSLKLRRKIASWDTAYLSSLLVNPDS